MIEELQTQFRGLKPSGAILNLPLYDWKSIFTTNYDELIEDTYRRKGRLLAVYTTNHDFGVHPSGAVPLFKLHGTIGKDIAFGDKSRIILTDSDYALTEEYREYLFDRLKSDLASAHLVIIGHSLADADIKDVVSRALSLRAKSGGRGRISILLYTPDEGRAALFEARGLEVCFGSLDDFFAGLVSHIVVPELATTDLEDPLDVVNALRPSTVDAIHSQHTQPANASAIYNGWPATYSDVASGLTFRRDVANDIEHQFLELDAFVAVLLGPSGVGKTSAARQAMVSLSAKGYFGWEHKSDQILLADKWRGKAAHALKKAGSMGVLLVDEAHLELMQVNKLIDALSTDDNKNLKMLLVSTNHQWRPRVKTPSLYKVGVEYFLSRGTGW